MNHYVTFLELPYIHAVILITYLSVLFFHCHTLNLLLCHFSTPHKSQLTISLSNKCHDYICVVYVINILSTLGPACMVIHRESAGSKGVKQSKHKQSLT